MRTSLRSALFTIALLVALGGAAGTLVLLSGIAPIAASAGHFAITRAILDLGKRRAVATHSLGIEPPELARPELVFKGAGHYETGCRPCHGRPGSGPPPVAQAMLPAPPDLAPRVARWDPEELFYIVKHGIKLTGMPAWPSPQRDDEVWAMVAFLLRAPELGAAGYEQLVHGATRDAEPQASELQGLEAPKPPSLVQTCARCHGTNGAGRMPGTVPQLAGQRRRYFVAALDAYAAGDRHSGIMAPIAANLTAEQRSELAAAYAGLPLMRGAAATGPSGIAAQRGAVIANDGIIDQGVPPCSDCHGPGPEPKNPMYPQLAAQYADYLVLQLELFEAGRRGGSSYAHLMRHVATRLTPEQMQDVAAYYSSLPPAGAHGED